VREGEREGGKKGKKKERKKKFPLKVQMHCIFFFTYPNFKIT
jgi:hypothetical protein